jgi:hypothetical protein
MNRSSPKPMTSRPARKAGKLLQSGIIFSAISFLTGLGNFAFQGVLGRHLKAAGDYGNANSALGGLMMVLGLLPAVAVFAVTHYIAHFKASGDSARLQGLLLGCRKFLFRLTIAGSVLAVLLVKPLSVFFHYNESLMLVTLCCALLGLWVALATALCQGLSWFKRLALLGFLAMTLRVSVRLVRHPQMAVGGNRSARHRLLAAGVSCPAFLEKGFVAARHAGLAVEPRIHPIPRGQRGICGRLLLFHTRRLAGDATLLFRQGSRRPMLSPNGLPSPCPRPSGRC